MATATPINPSFRRSKGEGWGGKLLARLYAPSITSKPKTRCPSPAPHSAERMQIIPLPRPAFGHWTDPRYNDDDIACNNNRLSTLWPTQSSVLSIPVPVFVFPEGAPVGALRTIASSACLSLRHSFFSERLDLTVLYEPPVNTWHPFSPSQFDFSVLEKCYL